MNSRPCDTCLFFERRRTSAGREIRYCWLLDLWEPDLAPDDCEHYEPDEEVP